MANDKKEIMYLNIIKILACFMVIINHTNGVILDNKTISNVTFYCITFSLCKIGVALFLMITGALAIKKEYCYKKILNCILRVLVPTLGLSFIFYVKDIGINNINIINFIKLVISNPYIEPYWYIYALIGIYLVLPFIQKMVKNFTDKDYITFLSIFLIIPSFINLIRSYINIDINYNWQLAFFPILIATVICGDYIARIKLSKNTFTTMIFIFITSYLGMFLSMYLPYLNNGEVAYTLDYWSSFPVILMSISIFYIIRYLMENKKYSYKIKNIISVITSTTFGIYLIHTSINYKIYELGMIQSMFNYNSILGVIVLDVLVFIICMLIIYILKKIPIVRNYL